MSFHTGGVYLKVGSVKDNTQQQVSACSLAQDGNHSPELGGVVLGDCVTLGADEVIRLRVRSITAEFTPLGCPYPGEAVSIKNIISHIHKT